MSTLLVSVAKGGKVKIESHSGLLALDDDRREQLQQVLQFIAEENKQRNRPPPPRMMTVIRQSEAREQYVSIPQPTAIVTVLFLGHACPSRLGVARGGEVCGR